MSDNRLVYFRMTHDLLIHALQLPDGVTFRGMIPPEDVYIYVSGPDFPELVPGNLMPEVVPTLTRVTDPGPWVPKEKLEWDWGLTDKDQEGIAP